ncbi:carbohydrate ABC transporter permease [Cohnella sp.]|uniref:carbohydrate ABC transporter permease n=1 Tax=Cohnella sp. TaxID=1883426 RepID=UPI0035663D4E
MNRRTISRFVVEAASVLLSLSILIPFFMVVINSLKDLAGSAEMSLTLPKIWHFENYVTVYREANILQAFKNSFVISFAAVAGLVIFSAMAGYVLQRRKNKFTEMVNLAIMLGLVVPMFIIPTYVLAKNLHLTGGLEGMILVCIAINFPIGVFLFSGYYKTIPKEIDESALLDGCGPYSLFFRIILPLLMPITATNIVIQFLSVWNDFGTSIYFLNSQANYNLIMTTFLFFGTHSADWNYVFADLVFISVPVIIMYLFFQRFVISGLTNGAVKG